MKYKIGHKIVLVNPKESSRIRSNIIFSKKSYPVIEVWDQNSVLIWDDNMKSVLVFGGEIELSEIFNSPLYKALNE